MVANIRSGSSPGGALRYNKEKVDKDEAEVLLWQKMLEPYDKCGRLVKCTPNIGRISICLDGMSSVLYRAHVV